MSLGVTAARKCIEVFKIENDDDAYQVYLLPGKDQGKASGGMVGKSG